MSATQVASRVSAPVFIFTFCRAVIGLIFGIADTAFFSVLVLLSAVCGQQRLATRLISFWSKMNFAFFGIELLIEGEENLPDAGGGILVFNHQSHFDITALCAATDKQIRFGAKIELFKIPFFGRAMRSIGTLPIARDNRSGVMKIYAEAAKRFAEGTIFVLAPEGTRQSEPVIGRFKKGPFIFALNAGVPVIPAVIKGAYEVLPKQTVFINVGRMKRVIHVRFLPPVSTQAYELGRVDELAMHVRTQMASAFDSMPARS